MATKGTLGYSSWGSYVEWYRDDDCDSGYGDNAQTCRWWGTTAECRERIKRPAPKRGWSAPQSEHYVDAATATGMYDHF